MFPASIQALSPIFMAFVVSVSIADVPPTPTSQLSRLERRDFETASCQQIRLRYLNFIDGLSPARHSRARAPSRSTSKQPSGTRSQPMLHNTST
ncbi:hypothetical protein B0F90DRAFT_1733536 [Multifurca ochricompacta]|uniref:Secreted protein n=1 Tax=Multifurca ochricompacta TaxID=376703 RepID=A0AAD4QJP0_9AGAM|nr:hypothetical protein B0F90DRAFT_1733536 [Multifurca ochricompacta]